MLRTFHKWLGVLTLIVVLFSTASAQAPTAPGSAPTTHGKSSDPTTHSKAAAPPDEATQAEMSEWWSSGRYRLTPNDVFEVSFPYVPEFNQTAIVQPDGYVSLKPIGEIRVEGRTLPELKAMLLEEYESILREPVITIALKEFEKPYFVAAGEIKTPGKYDLRGATTLTQALAIVGGPTSSANQSQIVLFRRFTNDLLETKVVNVSHMLGTKNLSEDPLLRPGDYVFVPKSVMSQIAPFIPKPSIGIYLNPFDF